MSVEATLFSVLGPLVGNRVFPDTAPLNTTKPYITYQQVGGSVIVPLGKDIPDKQNARMQIMCWAGTRLASKALSLQVEDALRTDTTFMSANPEAACVAISEPDLGIYGSSQDFSIWYTR